MRKRTKIISGIAAALATAGIVAAAPGALAHIENRCVSLSGGDVLACPGVSVWHDSQQAYGFASIEDFTGRGRYEVAVSKVVLQQ